MRSRARVARIDGTASALAPASKVSAASFSLMGRRSTSCPDSFGEKDGGPVAAGATEEAIGAGLGALTGAGLPQPATVTVAARTVATSATPVRTGGRYVRCPDRATPSPATLASCRCRALACGVDSAVFDLREMVSGGMARGGWWLPG